MNKILSKASAVVGSVVMLASLLSSLAFCEVPEPLPSGVNAGYQITDQESFTAARDNSYLIGGGNVEYTTLADDPGNEVLKLTANSENTDRYQWDFAFLTKEPLTVGGTYEISYKILVPEEVGKGDLNAQVMREGTWQNESPNPGAPITKNVWTEVVGTLVVEDTPFSEIRFLLNQNVSDLPTEWYMDDITIKLVDYAVQEEAIVGVPNGGMHITFDEATDRAKVENDYVAGGGTAEWVTGAEVDFVNDGNLLKATMDSSTVNSSWQGAYNMILAEPISVNGTYKVSYRVYVPSEGNTGKDDVRAGFVIDNGFGSGYGVTEFPTQNVIIPKDTWVEVSATLPKMSKNVDWFALRFIGGAAQHPNVYYIDDFEIELVDFDNTPPIVPGWEPDTASLKDAFEGVFKMGNILQVAAFTNDTDGETKREFLKQYNAITLENAMKPSELSSAKDTYDFTSADMIVDWALENELDVHGHVFVWHSQSPGWLNVGLTRAEAKENMENYIKTVAEHFQGRVGTWDVVNEAFYNDAQDVDGNDVENWREGLRSIDTQRDGGWGDEGSAWYTAYANGMDVAAGEDPGDYIYDAFVFARQYAPDATLFYNDFNDEVPNKVKAICNMINELNGQWENDPRNTEPGRLLIEGMGLQSHYSTTWTNNTDNVRKALEAYIATGVEIDISELDVSIENTENEMNTPENQRRIYNELFEIYTSPGIVEHISRITLWGMHDGVSWRGARRCLPFDLNQKAKPVFADIIEIGESFVYNAGNATPPGGVTPPEAVNPSEAVNPPGDEVIPDANKDDATNKENTAPKTGDVHSSVLYIGMVALCAGTIAYLVFKKKKKA